MTAWAYMLRCSDGSYYVGSHCGEYIEQRVQEHQFGQGGTYTKQRLPLALVWCQHFDQITDAIATERQIKGWGRKKKEALMNDDWTSLMTLSKRRSGATKACRASDLRQ